MSAASVLSPLNTKRPGGLSGMDDDGGLFEQAPPVGLQKRIGLVRKGKLNIGTRALLVILLGWVPLLVLALVQSAFARADVVTPFLLEVGAHARYLVAAPLLVIAEAACAPQLNAIVRHFADSGIVADGDRDRFDEAVASTRGWLQSGVAEVLAILLAYLISVAAALSHSPDQLPLWAAPVAGVPHFSLAGWWHMLVSLPLLLLLIFGWLWRLALWTRLLWVMARLELRLVASHPDRCAGLSFLGQSIRAFAIVALALAVIIAGRSAHIVLTGGGLPTPNFLANVGLLVTIMLMFVAPLVMFTPTLMHVWRSGTLQYDALADGLGHAFERKWLAQKVGQDVLERPDFSATADLYSVVGNVHAIRLIPVDLKDLIALAVAMLVPFVPVVLLAFPLDEIWKYTKSLLL